MFIVALSHVLIKMTKTQQTKTKSRGERVVRFFEQTRKLYGFDSRRVSKNHFGLHRVWTGLEYQNPN